jgi:beta-galactosidase
MVQYEFPVWTGGGWYKEQGYSRTYNADKTIRQFRDWMRDNWNHPSVVVWDAANETRNEIFNAKVIPAVRGLDLSHRPWEDSYNPPGSSGDVEEFHGYLFDQGAQGKLAFTMSDLEAMDGSPAAIGLDIPVPSTNNAVILNEYDALWLNRDGTPTDLTANLYAQLIGTRATAQQRLNERAYLLAGLTEYWRAHRQMAGVDYFVYLTSNIAHVPTSDNWSDVRRLKLDPDFVTYVGEAFKPLGVYIDFFHPFLQAGSSHEFLVKMINDYGEPMAGELVLTLETAEGKTLAKTERPFDLAALGASDFSMTLPVPDKPQGKLILKAAAIPSGNAEVTPTISRRWLSVTR